MRRSCRVLCDYIVYVDHNMRKALELAAAATQVCTSVADEPPLVGSPLVQAQPHSCQLACNLGPASHAGVLPHVRTCMSAPPLMVPCARQACGYEDWWWKARLGKAYYQLGLLRDAEQQLASSLRNQVRRPGSPPIAGRGCTIRPSGSSFARTHGHNSSAGPAILHPGRIAGPYRRAGAWATTVLLRALMHKALAAWCLE